MSTKDLLPSAAGGIIAQTGFYYQNLFGLYLLLSQPDKDIEKITIETKDDVAIEYSDGSLYFYQIKHHGPDSSKITTDFWSTLEAWSDSVANDSSIDIDLIRFFLNTTETPKNPNPIIKSVLSVAQADEEVNKIIDKIKVEINKNKTTQLKTENDKITKENKEKGTTNPLLIDPNGSFVGKKFLNLTDSQQIKLLKQAKICPSQLDINEVENNIKRIIESNNNRIYTEKIYEEIRNYWIGLCNDMIRFKIEYISVLNFTQQKILIYDNYIQKLPTNLLLLKPNEIDETQKVITLQKNPNFEHQLNFIGLGNIEKESAKIDLIRAFITRTQWHEELSLLPQSLNKDNDFDRELENNWQRYFNTLLGAIDSENTSFLENLFRNDTNHKKQKGLEFYKEFIKNCPKPRFRDIQNDTLVIGSYHILAGRTTPHIGWHPDYLTLLQQVNFNKNESK